AAFRREKARRLRMDADPLPQCHFSAQEPVLCGRLRLWQRREAHRDRRRTGPQELRPPQAARRVGGSAEGSPRRLYRLGGVRTEPEAARGQRLWQGGRCEVGAWRTRVVGWADILWALRATRDGKLLGPPARPARLS